MFFTLGKRAALIVSALALVGAASTSKAQNLLTNGSFEQGNFVNNGANAQSLAVGATNITGWTVVNNELAWILNGNPYSFTASTGNFSLDLTGYHDSAPYGGVQQTIATTAGQQYQLSFDIGAGSASSRNRGPNSVTASADSTSQTFTFNPTTGTDDQYGTFSLTFTASAQTTTISLIGAASGSGQFIGLDNASVTAITAVPEPGSVAILVGMGVAGTGLLARRKRRTVRV